MSPDCSVVMVGVLEETSDFDDFVVVNLNPKRLLFKRLQLIEIRSQCDFVIPFRFGDQCLDSPSCERS